MASWCFKVMENTYQCKECREILSSKEFYLNKLNRDGHALRCKKCCIKAKVLWQKKNREKHRKICLKSYYTNREKRIKSAILWAKNNPEKRREYDKQRRTSEKYKKRQRLYNKKKRSTVIGKLNESMAVGIRTSLCGNKKGRHWESLVGYTAKQLKLHLGKKFKKGMTWDNYGEWHIDHIIPISVFNFEKPEDDDFKKCWGLKNLQPLWKIENIKKGNKLTRPFQPSFMFLRF